MKRTVHSIVSILILASILLISPAYLHAADIYVTIDVDATAADGWCTLREAVIAANTNASYGGCTAGTGDDTIILPAGTYTLLMGGTDDISEFGDLDVLENLSIIGAGRYDTIIDADSIDRAFHILNSVSNPYVTASFTGMTITGGNVSGNGGGIFADHASITSDDLLVTACAADYGGGIYIIDGSADLTSSFLSGNMATADGGGIHLSVSSTASINSSTIYGNMAGGDGGGIFCYKCTTDIVGSKINGANASGGYGGGIQTHTGVSYITDSTIDSNESALGGGGVCTKNSTEIITGSRISQNSSLHGGGIYVGNGQKTTIINSTFIKNLASGGDGGGVHVTTSGISTIANSTFSENNTTGYGGGVFAWNYAEATVINSTISGNSADQGGGIGFPGVSSSVKVGGSILSDNTATTSGPDCLNSGTFNSLGYNIANDISSGGCVFESTGDQTNVDPLLDILADNGSRTITFALLPGSPAIDAGDPQCTGTDQRGTSRPRDGDFDGTAICDIGAYEYSPPFSLSGTSLDFGMIEIDTISSPQEITVTNLSDRELSFILETIDIGEFQLDTGSGSSPCDMGSSELFNLSIGASCTFTVAFAPTSMESPPGSLELLEITGVEPVIVFLDLSGTAFYTVPATLSLSTMSQDLGSIEVDATSGPVEITLGNTGDLPLDISDINLSGTDASDFSFAVDGGGSPCGSLTPTISAGGSCTLTVSFSPTSTGLKGADLNIVSGTPSSPDGAVTLTGTGVPVPVPAISLSSSSIDFGTIGLSGTADSTITLSNDGTADLYVSLIGGGDPLEAPFSIVADTCSRTSIAPGNSCEITVRIDPSTAVAASAGLGGLGIIMLGLAIGSGTTRRRKTAACLLILVLLSVGLLAACGGSDSSPNTPAYKPTLHSDTFNISSDDPDTPDITVSVSGSF